MSTEFLTDADTFTVNFPVDATAEQKARIMGAAFLVNMMEYETQADNGGAPNVAEDMER